MCMCSIVALNKILNNSTQLLFFAQQSDMLKKVFRTDKAKIENPQEKVKWEMEIFDEKSGHQCFSPNYSFLHFVFF